MSTKLDRHAPWQEIGRDGLPPRPGTREPAPIDPAVLAEKEDSRLRLRARLKKAMAESVVAESRWQEISEVVQKLESKKEDIAADHVAACSLIQAELALLRKNQVNRILAGDDTDSDESRRIELQEKISELNAKLEKQIADIDASLSPLLREQLAVVKQIDSTLRGDLMNSASEENRIRLMVARSRCEFLHRRVQSVRESLSRRPSDALLPHLLIDAELMLNEANKLSSDAVQRCVEE